ncbi:hypothetical protein RJ641_004233 [Dillenia turbinata]|uniref:Uncharacterized protein n=1 Tax=Dillenia turbinata TaxID=194707 RepID=A0AAN8VEC8_9MAGN
MGQAFRRASGKIPSSGVESSSSSSSRLKKTVIDRREIPISTDKFEVSKTGHNVSADSDDVQRINADNILEERDPSYDAMLSQMVGRIRSKPGGKLEMGEASVVEKYNRPMPKLRNTKVDSGSYEERPVPTGTLNVAQLRHTMLLHQGKADDHQGPMDVRQIAEKFQIDVSQVQKILQFISLPPEDTNKQQIKH